jgi:hypothetical protein
VMIIGGVLSVQGVCGNDLTLLLFMEVRHGIPIS